MRKIFSIIVIIVVLFMNNTVWGNQVDTVQNTEKEIKVKENVSMRYLAAWTALAVYNDKLSLLAREVLVENGWKIDVIDKNMAKSDIKLLLAEKQMNGKTVYFLSVSGTTSWKDIQTDLSVGSTPFNEKNENCLVHKGFLQYMQDGFFTEKIEGNQTLGEKIEQFLSTDKSHRIYITGHSLGGAVAELLAAKLSDMGASKNQLEVITFGAPAVGNQVFVDTYEPKINLTRITMKGDPIKNLAQIANTKYVQFATNTEWKLPQTENDKFAHNMLLYFDGAMRDYYDMTQMYASLNTGNLHNLDCIVGVSFTFPPELKEETRYIYLALMDKLRHSEKSCLFLEKENLQGCLVQAKKLKAKQVVMYQFSAAKLKENTSNRRYYVDEMKYIYDVNGNLVNGFSASTDTNDLTTVQAALYTDNEIDRMQTEKSE